MAVLVGAGNLDSYADWEGTTIRVEELAERDEDRVLYNALFGSLKEAIPTPGATRSGFAL